jgi:threonine dehydratase
MAETMIGLPDILEARRQMAPYVSRTPLRYSPALSRLSGAQVWLKLENLQPTGSFKVRGALNKVARLTADERARGLVTASAGNHGLGVAYAARSLGGVAATIFLPDNAPRAKVEKLERFPVRLHQEGQSYNDAVRLAEAFAAAGATMVPAYNDRDVIAGQATIGLEIFEELPTADVLIVPAGGGGLIAGIALVAAALAPECRIVGAEPAASPSAYLSLRDGVAYDPYESEPTLADGLAGGFGALPLTVAGALIDQVLLASEDEMRRAIFTLLDAEQLVVEASGAVAICPLLDGSLPVAGKTVVCVLSGGNLDTALLGRIIAEYSTGTAR